jgi:hypothetical protein
MDSGWEWLRPFLIGAFGVVIVGVIRALVRRKPGG